MEGVIAFISVQFESSRSLMVLDRLSTSLSQGPPSFVSRHYYLYCRCIRCNSTFIYYYTFSNKYILRLINITQLNVFPSKIIVLSFSLDTFVCVYFWPIIYSYSYKNTHWWKFYVRIFSSHTLQTSLLTKQKRK